MTMKKIFILISVITFSINGLQSQIIPLESNVKTVQLSEKDNSVLKKHLNRYSTFEIDKKQLLENLSLYGKCHFRLNINSEYKWDIDLQVNNMTTPDYKAFYSTDDGSFLYEEPYVPNTYKGETSSGDIVRLTIDDDEFWGLVLKEQEQVTIRHTRHYTGNKEDNSLVIFNNKDVILSDDDLKPINDIIDVPIEENPELRSIPYNSNIKTFAWQVSCPYHLTIATDADYEFYQQRGSNLADTYNFIFSVLNMAEGAYQSTFNLKFMIPYMNVWTTSSDPYTQMDDSLLLLEFRDIWNLTHMGVYRNIAHLFTGKAVTGGTGRAYVGQIENPNTTVNNASFAYGVSFHNPYIYKTTTHEIGHNLNGQHVTDLINCQCSGPDRSVMCPYSGHSSLWFCQQSINEINPFLYSNRALLQSNFVNTLTLTSGISGFNFYQAISSITSSQIINSGFTAYRSASIILQPGFEVKLGAAFSAEIKDITDCGN